MKIEHVWVAVGLMGQGAFAMRLLIQWASSERQKKSVVPVAFWYWSLLGGVTLLSYAIHRRDPVFILGQLFGTGIYARNIYLIKAHTPVPGPGEAGG